MKQKKFKKGSKFKRKEEGKVLEDRVKVKIGVLKKKG